MSATPHFPGEEVKRQYEGYSAWQQALWEAFDDPYWAAVNGYEHCRKPAPWIEIEQERYEKWEENLYKRWWFEAGRDKATTAKEKGDIPEAVLQYMFQTMVAADPLKPDLKKPQAPPYGCPAYSGVHPSDGC